MDKYWWDYLFCDSEEGYFLVEIEVTDPESGVEEATAIAKDNFDDPEYLYDLSPDMGEMLGYDTF